MLRYLTPAARLICGIATIGMSISFASDLIPRAISLSSCVRFAARRYDDHQ